MKLSKRHEVMGVHNPLDYLRWLSDFENEWQAHVLPLIGDREKLRVDIDLADRRLELARREREREMAWNEVEQLTAPLEGRTHDLPLISTQKIATFEAARLAAQSKFEGMTAVITQQEEALEVRYGIKSKMGTRIGII
ncbi:hypothetical protein U1839_21160 [Sphingomonas sp. RT2P30]|uniref:hypothetical protein n=1 Tax=Parasphingomonas halimpatiens TaxID=3096162 RepID=UPI002FC83BB2